MRYLMKIIHCSDIHLDSAMSANLTAEKADIRRNEIKFTFEKMLDYAVEENVKAILICGDLFDKAKVPIIEKKYLSGLFNKFSQLNFFILSGNHDSEIFDNNFVKPNNVKIFNKDWLNYEFEGVNICGKELNNQIDNDTYDPPVKNDLYNIVMLHGEIGKQDEENKINILKLKNKGINYLALGHIHSYLSSNLDGKGVYAYSGCLEGRGFDETGDKGFIILDTILNVHKFIKFNSRTFYDFTVNVNNKNFIQIKDDCLLCFKNVNLKDLARIKLAGQSDNNLDVNLLRQLLSERCFYLKIDDEIRSINSYLFSGEISLKGEFIKLVAESEINEQDKEDIIKYGIAALTAKGKRQ